MATQLCQKCKQAHPGRVCDYDDKAECAETIGVDEVAAQQRNEPFKKEEDWGSLRSGTTWAPRVMVVVAALCPEFIVGVVGNCLNISIYKSSW